MAKILLIRPERLRALEEPGVNEALVAGGHAVVGTPIVVDPNLPETDAEGNPVWGFLVEADRIWAWKGEPIKLPEWPKKDG